MLCLLAALAMLCGCRRETARQGNESKGSAAPASAADPRPAIVCFGDSLTAGFGVDSGKSFPDVLQQELDSAGYRYRVVNLGVSGDTAQDGIARLQLALAEKSVLAVVEFGANDGLRGLPVASARSNLAQIVEAFQQAGARVVLAGMTLPPNYGPQYIRSFEAMYRDLAAQYKLDLIPFLLQGVAGDARLMQQDGLHPNAQGTRRVAATVFQAIRPRLKTG